MSIDKEAIASFYDEHSERMLRDFVYGNLRVSSAIEVVVETLKGRNGKLLDIGCGIGAASHSYAEVLSEFTVFGLDISPKSIQIADRLFASDRVSFGVSDMRDPPPGGPFDALVLIDVYEHIPRDEWPRFNAVLSSCLTPTGVVILTTPSPLHQQFLHEHRPGGLQIVDETVEVDDIVQLGKDLDAKLTYYSWESIWKTNQYLHVVLERRPAYTNPPKIFKPQPSIANRILRKARQFLGVGEKVGSKELRRQYVRKRLGLYIE